MKTLANLVAPKRSNPVAKCIILQQLSLYTGLPLFLFCMLSSIAMHAANVNIELLSGSQFLSIKNEVKNGPEAAYISFQVCNQTGESMINLLAKPESFFGNNFGLAGNQLAGQSIRKLGPGECKTLYWFVQYDADLKDDTYGLLLNVYQQADQQNNALLESSEFLFTAERALEASAGGQIMDVAVGGGSVIGSLTEFEVEYSFGNIKAGTELIFQPAGNLDFDAKSYQLVGTEILSSDVPSVPVGDKGKMYYISDQSVNGTDHLIRIKYYFKNSYIGSGSKPLPYAAMVSGNVYKMTGNYGSDEFDTSFPILTHGISILSSADSYTARQGESVSYKVSVINESDQLVSLDKLENQLPDQFVFLSLSESSEINESIITELPQTGTTGSLNFVAVESEQAYAHTGLLLQPKDTVELIFEAEIPTQLYDGDFSNTSFALVGETTTGESSSTLCVGTYPCTLPVNWNAFSARQEEHTGLLQWEINNEGTGAYFQIQRSVDGNIFETISRMDARKSIKDEQYSFSDETLFEMENDFVFYRVNHVDINGLSLHSEMVQLHINESPLSINLAPNPTVDQLQINYISSSDAPVSIKIYNSNGTGKYISTLPGGGNFEQQLPVSDWPAGIYYVELICGEDRAVKSFLKN